MLKYDLNNPLECIYIYVYIYIHIYICVRVCVCVYTNKCTLTIALFLYCNWTDQRWPQREKNASYISVSSHEPEWHIHISVKVYVPNFRWWMYCVTKVSHIATVSSKLVIAHIAGDISLSIFICKLHVAQYNIAYRTRVNVTYIGIISWLYF